MEPALNVRKSFKVVPWGRLVFLVVMSGLNGTKYFERGAVVQDLGVWGLGVFKVKSAQKFTGLYNFF